MRHPPRYLMSESHCAISVPPDEHGSHGQRISVRGLFPCHHTSSRICRTGGVLSTWAYNYALPGGATPPGCTATATGSGNNGNVIGYTYTDNVNTTYSHTALYVYDSVNRLACAQATGNSTYNLAYTYLQDGSNGQFGNMSCLLNGSTNGVCPGYGFNATTNHMSPFTYDAAGDVTADGIYTYQYDAEGRLASVDSGSTESYIYNALGQEVRFTTPNYTWDHVYDPAGAWIGRYSNGGWPVSGVFHLGSRPFAIYLDQAYFVHVNALGSTSMTSNAAGNVDGDSLLYPWGQSWVWGTPELHYAAFEYNDSATGLDPTLFRQYPPAQGRWLTPDPGGMKSSTSTTPRPGICMPTWAITPHGTLTDPSRASGQEVQQLN